MMKWLLSIVLWCGISYGATFTDVTIEGTPYLTTNVLRELEASALSRGLPPGGDSDAFSQSGEPANEIIAHTDTWIQEGEVANRNYYPYQYTHRFEQMRHMCNYAWKIWIHEMPTNSFPEWDDLFHTNQVDWFVAAGLSSNGWRNAIDYDPATNNWRDFNDPMYIYRTNAAGFAKDINQGDIVGPWIIDDLQLAMDYMQHQARSPRYDGFYGYKMEWSAATNGIADNRYSGGATTIYGQWPTIDAAKARAESQWARSGGGLGTYDDIEVYSVLYYSSYYVSYGAVLHNYTGYKLNYGSVETNSSLYFYGGDITAYWWSTNAIDSRDIETFDDHGYDVENGMFTLLGSVSVDAGTVTNVVLSNFAIGDPSVVPNWVEGVDTTTDGSRGFIAPKDKYYKIYSPDHPYTR